MDDMINYAQPDAGGEIAIVDERAIHDKIYIVRGVKVMLDFELAEIYGYASRAFNQQVKNNASKFDDDFRFQLTREAVDDLVRSNLLLLPDYEHTKQLFNPHLLNPLAVRQSAGYASNTLCPVH